MMIICFKDVPYNHLMLWQKQTNKKPLWFKRKSMFSKMYTLCQVKKLTHIWKLFQHFN